MILDDRRNPEYSLYYQGFIFLSLIKKYKLMKNDLLGFFDFYKAKHKGKKITFPQFILLMDYLFLNNKVQLSKNGEIEICI